MPAPLVLLNAVGLTPRLLPHAPRLAALGWMRPLREALPAVTCTAQASILTGKPPSGHGVVGNGWLFRDTGEVRFWQQSNRLIESEPLYRTMKRRNPSFRCAKLFWWFNQGAEVDLSVTPKPWYGADGSKAFGIAGSPAALPAKLEKELGAFPFHAFWGPMAGAGCTEWIARAASAVLRDERPDLSLAYLPHLDYDPQRFGPQGCDVPRLVKQLDDACAPLLDEAKRIGAKVWVVSEYGHLQVSRPIFPNRALRQAGLLDVRPGPYGETLETFTSRAFAVCDHQAAHVYVRRGEDVPKARDALGVLPGVASILEGEGRGGLDHPRSGELVLLSEPDAWFAYPFWLDDRRAPDYARTVDIHRKPGYDPCELFFDPRLWWPKGRAVWKLLLKKLGFRILMDLIPLDAGLVKGSHGIAAPDPLDRPLLIGDGPVPGEGLAMEDAHALLLRALQE
ncbi:MAG: alkaline phosphatase family protein [Gemmataceae bacterium]|nr:alkaline phosphatase family protein [Gemmataceae bacterium]